MRVQKSVLRRKTIVRKFFFSAVSDIEQTRSIEKDFSEKIQLYFNIWGPTMKTLVEWAKVFWSCCEKISAGRWNLQFTCAEEQFEEQGVFLQKSHTFFSSLYFEKKIVELWWNSSNGLAKSWIVCVQRNISTKKMFFWEFHFRPSTVWESAKSWLDF